MDVTTKKINNPSVKRILYRPWCTSMTWLFWDPNLVRSWWELHSSVGRRCCRNYQKDNNVHKTLSIRSLYWQMVTITSMMHVWKCHLSFNIFSGAFKYLTGQGLMVGSLLWQKEIVDSYRAHFHIWNPGCSARAEEVWVLNHMHLSENLQMIQKCNMFYVNE